MAQKSVVEDVLLGIVSGYMGSLLIVWALVAIMLATWLQRRLRNDLAARPLSIVFGLFTFAVLLAIHGFFINVAEKVERKQAEIEKHQAEEQAQLSEAHKKPDDTIKAWLDRTGYSVKTLKPGPDDVFVLLLTTKDGKEFSLHQTKEKLDVLTLEIIAIPLPPFTNKLAKLSRAANTRFFYELRAELLRFDVEARIADNGLVHLHEDVPFDKSTRRTDLIHAIFHLARASMMVALMEENLFLGAYDHLH